MRHPTDGTLRRLLDEPAGVADADREHVAGCPVCLTGLSAAQRDAALLGTALDLELDTDVDAGWSRLSQAVAAGERRRVAPPVRSRRWRAVLRSPVIAVAGVVVLLTGASAAAAADWIQILRAEQIAPVTIAQADLVNLPDLSAYGEVELTDEPDVRQVADAAAARKATGLSVPRVRDLPHGVAGDPAFQVGGPAKAVFTFSAERAARTAAAAGATLPPPPPGLDGSQVSLVAGPGLAAVWAGGTNAPALVVARLVAPTASYSSGVPFETARDYLLSLPGLPPDVAAQLRGLSGDGKTLPLPVNAAELTSAPTDVDGHPATLLTTTDGVISGVVWVDDGVVTAVAGSLSADEVLTVARGLRWDR